MMIRLDLRRSACCALKSAFQRCRSGLAALLALGMSCSSLTRAAEEDKPAEGQRLPIPIAELKRTTAVDFEKEILPILKSNCLACHNQTTTKGELVLETPQTILKGGESGPVIVPGKSDGSLLLKLAAHQQK